MVRPSTVTLLFALGGLVAGPALADDLFIYPKTGQSEEQQSRDKYECHAWAAKETGFDPSAPPAVSTTTTTTAAAATPTREGGAVRGAARGAAIGAIGGAIAGDAGKGAAIGAGVGAAGGAIRRADARHRQQAAQEQAATQQQQASAQQTAKIAKQRDRYNLARKTCLEARDYTVN